MGQDATRRSQTPSSSAEGFLVASVHLSKLLIFAEPFSSFKRSHKHELSLATTLARLAFYKWQKLRAERKAAVAWLTKARVEGEAG